jgi:hypothetical protein
MITYNDLGSTDSKKPCEEGLQGVLLGVGGADHRYNRLSHCDRIDIAQEKELRVG